MKNKLTLLLTGSALIFTLSQCIDTTQTRTALETEASNNTNNNYGGFGSPEAWGEHIVIVSACHDCHTPKIMTDAGPVLDSARWLSGHPTERVKINMDRKMAAGLIVTEDLTEWIGAWGTTYTANLTSDATGIGNWSEKQFFTAIRDGKYKGMTGSRDLLPPMPWQMYRNMTDDELSAIFAYLKSTTPVRNIVPSPLPPA